MRVFCILDWVVSTCVTFQLVVDVDLFDIIVEVPGIRLFLSIEAVVRCNILAPLAAPKMHVVFPLEESLLVVVVKGDQETAIAFDRVEWMLVKAPIFLIPRERFVAFRNLERPGLVVSLDFAFALLLRLFWLRPCDTWGVRASACVGVALSVASSSQFFPRGPGTLLELLHFAHLSEFPRRLPRQWLDVVSYILLVSADLGLRRVWSHEARLAFSFPVLVRASASAHSAVLTGHLVAKLWPGPMKADLGVYVEGSAPLVASLLVPL